MLRDPNLTSTIADPSGRASIPRFNTLHPPFGNPKVRRAMVAAVNQEDYMRAPVGEDHALWRLRGSLFPRGTPYGTEEAGATLIKGDPVEAKRSLAASGYAGEKIAVINPTDFSSIGQLG